MLFSDGLAAVLGGEPKRGRKGSALLPTKHGSTEHIMAMAIYHEVCLWSREVIRACGQHPVANGTA